VSGKGGERARALFRAFLRAFPRPFRERFGREMEETFLAEWQERKEESAPTRAAFLLVTFWDCLRSGLAERVRPSLSGGAEDEGAPDGAFGGFGILGDRFRLDLLFALRSLARRPGFTGVVVLTLALGIGANTAIFSVVNGVLLRPLPYPDAHELVTVGVAPDDPGEEPGNMSYPDLADLEAGSPTLASVVGYSSSGMTVTDPGDPRIVDGTRVSAGLLPVFGLAPTLGRDIRAEEFGRDAARVVVVGHGFWERNFGASDDALGRRIEVNGVSFEVVGVAPEGFDFPDGTELWIPRRIDVEECARACHTWRTVGRLAPGATLEAARASADRIAANLSEAYPRFNTGKTFSVESLQARMVGDVRRGLWMLLGAVGLVLLIACANVANLLLVRASSRTGEVAVRAALGASRGRLTAQILVESAVLSVLGGAVGLGVAFGGVELLRRVSPGTIPRIDQVGIDGTVLLFAAGLVLAVTLLFGLSPALRLARSSITENLLQGGRGSGGDGGRRSRSALLAVEVALSLVLLVGAGLLLRTFGQLYAVDLGYETREVVRFTLNLPEARYDTLPEVRTFYRNLEDRIRSLPGVAAVGSIYGAPLGLGNAVGTVHVEGRPRPEPGRGVGAAIHPIGPGYLEAMRIPVIRGRGLEPSDDADAEPVAVVNRRFAERVFPGEETIGQRVEVTIDMGYGAPPWRIVGVVGDVRSTALTREPRPEIYVPHGQFGPEFMTVTVRAEAGAGGLLSRIRTEVREMDPNLPLIEPETMEEAVSSQVAPTRFYLFLVALFAGVAVVLAGVGLYGVVSYLVSRRTREIGLRVVLGADRGEIVRMVVVQGLRPAALGMAAGLAAALWGARLLESLLYGVPPRDPWVMVGVSLLLGALVVAASWLPARRATRVDPVEALRAE